MSSRTDSRAVDGEAPAGRHYRSAPRNTRADWVRFGLRGVGQTLITLGLVILLFVVYELWVTNIFAHAEQARVHNQLAQEWAKGDDPLMQGRLDLPGGKQSTIPIGVGIANLYVPRFGSDYHFTIVEGTDDASLEKGPGHYVGTALPGEVGNFSVAGHRVGKGGPFLNLDHLRPGDSIVVETKNRWYVYQVKGDPLTGDLNNPGGDGIPGREIVSPGDTEVIAAVPDHPGQKPTQRLMTLTTCHPKFTANQRMIIHAVLVREVPHTGNALPKELSGGTL